jgi:putative colanic acid biosynthesis UDP-glucose lipid carrier transferase
VPTRGLLRHHSQALDTLVRAIDALLGAVAGLLAYSIYPGTWPLAPGYAIALLLASSLPLVVFPSANVYQSWRGGGMAEEARRVALACLVVMVTLAFIAFASKSSEHYSRIWLFSWAALCWLLLVGFRLMLRHLLRTLRRHRFNNKRVLIIGAGEQGQMVSRHLEQEAWTGLEVIGFLDDHPRPLPTPLAPILGSIDDVADISRQHGIDEIWITLPLRDEARVKRVIAKLQGSTVSIRFVPDFFSLRLLNSAMSEVAGMPVFDICMTPMDGVNTVLKFLEDRVLASIILVLVSPVMLLIAAAVKLSSPGPVLFKQQRHGWGGITIEVYKFRTMIEHSEPDGQVTQATQKDPRITKIGHFLRRTSLDELPQFINVLQGRMSIVGPRPHALKHNEHYKEFIDSYMLRH